MCPSDSLRSMWCHALAIPQLRRSVQPVPCAPASPTVLHAIAMVFSCRSYDALALAFVLHFSVFRAVPFVHVALRPPSWLRPLPRRAHPTRPGSGLPSPLTSTRSEVRTEQCTASGRSGFALAHSFPRLRFFPKRKHFAACHVPSLSRPLFGAAFSRARLLPLGLAHRIGQSAGSIAPTQGSAVTRVSRMAAAVVRTFLSKHTHPICPERIRPPGRSASGRSANTINHLLFRKTCCLRALGGPQSVRFPPLPAARSFISSSALHAIEFRAFSRAVLFCSSPHVTALHHHLLVCCRLRSDSVFGPNV